MSTQKLIVFRAFRGEKLVSKVNSLDDLARILKERGMDPRGLRIVSSQGVRPIVRASVRARRQ